MSKQTSEEVDREITNWFKKCNAMMVESARGVVPQLPKMWILKKQIDNYFNFAEENFGKEEIDKAEKIIDGLIESFGSIKRFAGEKGKTPEEELDKIMEGNL